MIADTVNACPRLVDVSIHIGGGVFRVKDGRWSQSNASQSLLYDHPEKHGTLARLSVLRGLERFVVDSGELQRNCPRRDSFAPELFHYEAAARELTAQVTSSRKEGCAPA